jgi:hypothetical protein
MAGFSKYIMDECGAYLITDYFMENIMDFVKMTFMPEEVFDEDDLKDWALNNGFVEEE